MNSVARPDYSDSSMDTILSLLQIADSAFPIGSAAHSFGLETVIAEQGLTPDGLEQYIADVLQNGGRQEAWGCLMGWRLGQVDEGAFSAEWQTLNHTISALKTAHELRTASEKIGRRLLQLIGQLDPNPILSLAWQSQQTHHGPTFGLIAATIGVDERTTVAVFLQQMVKTWIYAAQRLQPIGQRQATEIAWNLKPLVQSIADSIDETLPDAYPGQPEMSGLRHPHLSTRLFIS